MVKLPRTKFEVFYAAYSDKDKIYGNVSKHVYQIIGKNYIQLGDEIVENRNKIARHNFDIIVYCELGMRMRPYWLSYSRLAPVQVTTWGHSETSGIDTIDYFISSKYFEHEKAQNHYSEQLVTMDSLSTYYFPPSQILVNNFKYQTRKDLGLDDNINLYGCIQSSFKISKQFEMILYHILDKDKNGYILMSHYKPFCKSQMDRIYETFGEEKFRRLVFYPAMDINSYLNLVKLFDVMLDPYPFGGCNTSYEAFDYDIPVVTLPTRFLNGRFTFGLYKKMGFIDMIATTADNYVKLAVKCGTDKQFRQLIVDKIKENKYSIFMEEESVQEWSKFFEEKGTSN
jgi:predicted O-linked N-acetylglucosamine transferase (SPINDLY family)